MPVLTDELLAEAENQHYNFQLGCYYSGSKKIDGALLLWSDRITDSEWDHAARIDTDEKYLPGLIEEVCAFYKAQKRLPAIWFTPFSKPKNAAEVAKKMGFKRKFVDFWMFYEGSKSEIKMPENFEIKQAKTEEEMRDFIGIFNKAHHGTLPEEHFHRIAKEYGECLLDSFRQKHRDKKIVHYLGFLGKEPVGVITLIYSGRFACLYNLGTLPHHRGRGIGSALMLNCVSEAMRNGANIIFLQTEGGEQEKLYSKLGFSTKFVAEGYVLE